MAVPAASAPLLAVVRLRALEGLFDGVGGQDAEDDGHAGVELDPLQAGRALAGHEVVVAGVAPDDRAEADHRVDRAGRGQPLGHQRQLEGARHPGHDGLVQVTARLLQGVEGPGQQPVGDAAVELGAGQAHPESGRDRRRSTVDGRPDPAGSPVFGVGREQGQVRGRHRGLRAGGPSARAWSGGTRCSPGWAWAGCSPARRYRGRSPRARRTWSGLLVMSRMVVTPRSTRIWAPIPYSRESAGSPSSRLASTVSNPSSWRL